jgi:hypothetical protein
MPIPDSDTESKGGEGIYTFLLIVSAVFFALAVGYEMKELSLYGWPGGASSEEPPAASAPAQ